MNSVIDYYPFGMQMPGRTFNSSESTFGFNGKINDNEVQNQTGSFQDYGFRNYDTRLCRFIKTDPISRFYPELTPYQFASNSPIWAVDLDGLEEYIRTYRYDNGKVTLLKVERNVELQEIINSNGTHSGLTIPYNKTTGEPFRKEERNTEQYKYVYANGESTGLRRDYDGNYVSGENEIMPIKEDNLYGDVYTGGNNPYVFINGKKEWDYRREPRNLVDAASLEHDQGYDEEIAEGFLDVLFNRGVAPADEILIKSSLEVFRQGSKGGFDRYTGQQISLQTMNNAMNVVSFFTLTLNFKFPGFNTSYNPATTNTKTTPMLSGKDVMK
jgi:RHS repeat-associated protein